MLNTTRQFVVPATPVAPAWADESPVT
jgi:hypothetical protein